MRFKTINVKDLNLSEANKIQFLYPNEPDWKLVADETLVALVKDYISEPNCATLALSELEQRDSALTKPLARWLLSQEDADKWLKESAKTTLKHEN